MPISFSVQVNGIGAAKQLADGEPQLKFTVQELIDKGILIKKNKVTLQSGGVEPQSKAFIIDLPYPGKDSADQVQYFIGLNTFLSIFQYNRSYFYAQSVAEFAEALGYKNQSVVPAESPSKNGGTKAATEKSKTKKLTAKKKVKAT
jgi:membrane-bound lytic murein transglycosylase B